MTCAARPAKFTLCCFHRHKVSPHASAAQPHRQPQLHPQTFHTTNRRSTEWPAPACTCAWRSSLCACVPQCTHSPSYQTAARGRECTVPRCDVCAHHPRPACTTHSLPSLLPRTCVHAGRWSAAGACARSASTTLTWCVPLVAGGCSGAHTSALLALLLVVSHHPHAHNQAARVRACVSLAQIPGIQGECRRRATTVIHRPVLPIGRPILIGK